MIDWLAVGVSLVLGLVPGVLLLQTASKRERASRSVQGLLDILPGLEAKRAVEEAALTGVKAELASAKAELSKVRAVVKEKQGPKTSWKQTATFSEHFQSPVVFILRVIIRGFKLAAYSDMRFRIEYDSPRAGGDGGDQRILVDGLTWEQLQEFAKRYDPAITWENIALNRNKMCYTMITVRVFQLDPEGDAQ